MQIKCLSTFLDGRDRFEAGDIRSVSDEKGEYFVANGWAENTDPNAPPVAPLAAEKDAKLDVKNTSQPAFQEGSEVKNG